MKAPIPNPPTMIPLTRPFFLGYQAMATPIGGAYARAMPTPNMRP